MNWIWVKLKEERWILTFLFILANPPTLFIENYWLGEQRLSTIANWFDPTDAYKLKSDGIKDAAVISSKILDNAVTSNKILDGSITADKIGTGAVTEDKIGTLQVTAGKIGINAITSPKILDGNITLPKLSQAVLDYINAAGGGTITNNPDDVTLETKPGSKIGIIRNQTRQMNFLGTTKYGVDTTLTLSNKFVSKDTNFTFIKLENSRKGTANDVGDVNFSTYNASDGYGGNTNKTITFGINVGANGARENTNLASFSWEVEGNFLGSFEPHWTWCDLKGVYRKPISLNLRKADGLEIIFIVVKQLLEKSLFIAD